MKKIIHVVGARPNFMKAAPVYFAIRERSKFQQLLVHTGQHYDERMSKIFFQQLGMPEPDINLEVGSASHAVMTAKIMIAFEEVVLKEKPDLVLVYGDVNSTIACALVAVKLGVKVGHVEAGLRSFDRGMPEELNRILTDSITDYFFTTSPEADDLLVKQGAPAEKVFFVGNGMIDTLVRLLPKAVQPANDVLKVDESRGFALVTLHRPSNVDDATSLKRILDVLQELGKTMQVVFPIHPRTANRIKELELSLSGISTCKPLGYLEFLWLQKNARMVLTDSGGVQEETTYLGVPCLTLRDNTERPVTVTEGTNVLIGSDFKLLQQQIDEIVSGNAKQGRIPDKWDGSAGMRTAELLEQIL
ncbi:non-hydrolyzing UDP-N-acetylglucosamine 2-epimerase [Rubellicoccus peritrichatus]|uniref:UDP-N-acetylglucosamine 2-epimerase (Non-hydrolyzing) n=1 Tax=Rubellicoccus peritrichatus TaxID=3080537 RepID=A0AAQ3QXJ7_9BACT|nr:UDP-N-acetylglucosamine 2-epimerase (non-hydrolyzing) [Puniceicoccus sp. CR14]WOO42930.1 UDP-N-acetylglucosamine 2-epimerase (non-hydrolyzing) [Puniceicoccus sp. CR14]